MPIEILMPALSPTMKVGTLVKWLKKEGDKVKIGDILAEIETDKATMEIESIDEGILGKKMFEEGKENIPVNSLIALLLEEGEDEKILENYSPISEVSAASTPKDESIEEVSSNNLESPNFNNNIAFSEDKNIFISPAAKKIAQENDIDIRKLKGTGPNGRIIKYDIISEIDKKDLDQQELVGTEEYEMLAISNIRRTIADRLLESKQTIPHFYLSVDCIMDQLIDLRKNLNNQLDNVRISINDFIIKAAALSLKKYPAINSCWDKNVIKRYLHSNIAVAVSLDEGLITPIIKKAEDQTIVNISKKMKELAEKAKLGLLAPEEYQGGSFTISNLGMYGIKEFISIINLPQSAILAIGSARTSTIVVEGKIKIATIMTVTLSCDHRVIDGAIASEWLKCFKGYLEKPLKILV